MAEEKHEHNAPDNESPGYEKSDTRPAVVVIITLLSIVILIAIGIVLNEYFLLTKERIVYESVLKPESAALRELRAREDEFLNSYKVLDKDKGIYQIPIDRAMQLVADEAFRARQKADRGK